MTLPRGGMYIHKAITALLENNARSATVYVDPKHTVVATRRGKVNKREKQISIVLTLGRPNYQSRKFIKACIKAKEPFPVQRVQLKFWPKRKKK